jgi:DNA replication protein DnaC
VTTSNGRSSASGRPETVADVLKQVGSFTQAIAESSSPEAIAQAAAAAAEGEAKKREQLTQAEQQARLARVKLLAADLGPRYSPERATLSGYKIRHAAQQSVVDRLRAIAGDVESFIAEGAGLVLYGWIGTGKDHLAAALLYKAALTVSARWFNGRDIFAASRDAIDQERGERQLFLQLTEPAVLCLSDVAPIVGDLSKSAWNVDLLYRVLDKRARELRSTWLTLNVKDEADAKARLTPPVWDRARDNAVAIECCWPSFRGPRE